MVVVALLLFFACTQTSNEFSITGHITDVKDGDVIVLLKIEGRVGKRFLQDTIRDGKFAFRGEIDSLENIRLTALGEKYPLITIPLWIEPGSKTKITGKNYSPTSWCVKSNVKEQQDEEIYREATRSLAAISDSLLRVYYQEGDKIAQAGSDEEKQKQRTSTRLIRQKLDSISFIEHRLIFEEMAKRGVTGQWLERLKIHAQTSAAYASMGAAYPEENIQMMQELYQRLSEEQKQSRDGELIYSYIFPIEKIGVGDQIARGSFFDPDGNEHQVVDYLGKGKYLLIDFWGMGCQPCIAAFPEMKEVHEAHGDKLTIIGISTDTHNIWMNGLEKHQLPWVNLSDFLGIEGYASFYGVHGIPFYVLVAPDGTIENIWMGYVKGMFQEIIKKIETTPTH